jgi:hypothetical protein
MAKSIKRCPCVFHFTPSVRLFRTLFVGGIFPEILAAHRSGVGITWVVWNSNNPRHSRGVLFGNLGALARHSRGVYRSYSSCGNPVVVASRFVEMWKSRRCIRVPPAGERTGLSAAIPHDGLSSKCNRPGRSGRSDTAGCAPIRQGLYLALLAFVAAVPQWNVTGKIVPHRSLRG